MERRPPSRAKILLIEDNPDDEELALLALKRGNFAGPVAIARDGAEAIDFLLMRGRYEHRPRHQNPNLILLDLKLPKMSGIEVLKALRSNADTKYTPVVVLTTSNQDEDIIESYRFGANSYVRKPVEFNEFAQAISQLGAYWLTWNEVPHRL